MNRYTTKSGMTIDESRVFLGEQFAKVFKPIHFDEYIPIKQAISENILSKESKVFASEINGKYLVFESRQMHLHHTLSGSFENQNWMFGFCGICNSGSCFDPTIYGEVLNFSTAGFYNGYALWKDAESNSLWEHLTGECFKGKYKGQVLKFLSNLIEFQISDLLKTKKEIFVLHKRKTGLAKLIHKLKFSFLGLMVDFQKRTALLPPNFKASIGIPDERLDRDTMGICIWNDNHSKFYKKEKIYQRKKIKDNFDNKELLISIHEYSKIPFAKFYDGSEPKQNFMRWYGASATFPGIEIFEDL